MTTAEIVVTEAMMEAGATARTEAIEAARAAYEKRHAHRTHSLFRPCPKDWIAQTYRAMRALEPDAASQ